MAVSLRIDPEGCVCVCVSMNVDVSLFVYLIYGWVSVYVCLSVHDGSQDE